MRDSVKEYYGETLQCSDDLQTNACCTGDAPPEYLRTILSKIHDEVLSRYYGCGLIAPEQLQGLKILDLGSGSGRDCYALSALVGEQGFVVGVDMTPEQLAIANRYIDFHADVFSYQKPNVEFMQGELENLDQLDLQEGSFDIIVSNCVINLCEDKEAVLRHAYKLLKPGGEMYFSDVYADRRMSDELRKDPVLFGECLSGAYYWNDFILAAKDAGFKDPRLVKDSPITIENDKLAQKLGDAEFYSATYRLFKMKGLEDSNENYGQQVTYMGGIENCPNLFELDKSNQFSVGESVAVSGNTYRLLQGSRFVEFFDLTGDFSSHLGINDCCGEKLPFDKPSNCCKPVSSCC